MSRRDVAVFDLDGTLLNGDATASWLRAALSASPLRLLTALPVLLPALALIRQPRLRRYGASMLLWIASVGLDEGELRRRFSAFAKAFHNGEMAMRWYADALAALEGHHAAGDRVVVVTATPQWLADPLLRPLGPWLDVIGSRLGRSAGGWAIQRHCSGAAKVQLLHEHGYGKSWASAYSDSEDDAPMLQAANAAFLINGRSHTVDRILEAGVSQVTLMNWR